MSERKRFKTIAIPEVDEPQTLANVQYEEQLQRVMQDYPVVLAVHRQEMQETLTRQVELLAVCKAAVDEVTKWKNHAECLKKDVQDQKDRIEHLQRDLRDGKNRSNDQIAERQHNIAKYAQREEDAKAQQQMLIERQNRSRYAFDQYAWREKKEKDLWK